MAETRFQVISQNAESGSTSTPSASITFNRDSLTAAARATGIQVRLTICACTVDTDRGFDILSVTGDLPVSGNSYFVGGADYVLVNFEFPYNSGSTSRSSTVVCKFYDTSGNSYTDSIVIQQNTGQFMIFYPDEVNISSSAQTVCTEMVIHDIEQPYEIYLNYSGMTGFTEFPTPVLNNNMLCMDIPKNETGTERRLSVQYTLSSDTRTYPDSFLVFQASGASIGFMYKPGQVVAASTWITAPLRICGCTLDADRLFEIVSISGDLPLSAHAYTVTSRGSWAQFSITRNPGTTERSSTVVCRFYDTSGNSYTDDITITQRAAAWALFEPDSQTISSSAQTVCVELLINSLGEPYQMEISESGLTGFTELPAQNWNGNNLCMNIPENQTSDIRKISLRYQDVNNTRLRPSFNLTQEAKVIPGTPPDPWSNTGDTAYTWYKDDSLLRVLPSSRILSYDEETAYWPVTAHTFDNVGVRASGDVVFNYELLASGSAEFNSHRLYAHTQNNTGTTQQVSTIKLVAFSGSSAYSASTVLMKNPDSHGWITASPNPVNAVSTQNSVNVYLTLTNCERNINKEATDNAEFDAATWVSVSRVNNTTLTFNFQANNSNQARSTYYYAYGLDSSGNNVYCRIDITQEADSMGITITPDRTSLGKPAGSFTARVESTENGNFSFSAASWMVVRSYVPESQKAGTLYVDYYENTVNYTRVGDITVSQQISTAPYTLTGKTQISQTSTADTAYIRVTPSSISVDRTAGVVEAQVSYDGLATVPALVQNEGNMSIVSYNLDSGLITIAYGANDTSMDKYKNFAVTAMSSDGNVIEANFTITQGGTGLPIAPIWRDYVITVPTPGQGYINYNINYDGTVVYTGRAYGMGQDNIEIYYNHLCKPFLSNHIEFTEGYQSIRDWLGNFIITSPELGDITSVSFYEDYSYENRDMEDVMTLNNPIVNEVPEGGIVPFSLFSPKSDGYVEILSNKPRQND